MKIARFCALITLFVLISTALASKGSCAEQRLHWEFRLKEAASPNFSEWAALTGSLVKLDREFRGYIEYRSKLSISNARPRASNQGLYLGRVGEVDQVYVNDVLIGQTGRFPPNYYPELDTIRVYPLPLLKEQNEIRILVYTEYVAEKGVDFSKVAVGDFAELQQRKYRDSTIWYFLKLGPALLCLILSIAAMPWFSPKQDAIRSYMLCATGICYFVFGLGKSRIIFHFLSTLVSYKIVTLSALFGLACLFMYAIDICYRKSELSKNLFAAFIGIPITYAIIIGSAKDFQFAAEYVKYWLCVSVVLNLAIVALLIDRWRRFELDQHMKWIFSGMIALMLIAIHDVFSSLKIVPTKHLMEYAFSGFVVLAQLAQASYVRRTWVRAEEKKRADVRAMSLEKVMNSIAHDIISPAESIREAAEKTTSSEIKDQLIAAVSRLNALNARLKESRSVLGETRRSAPAFVMIDELVRSVTQEFRSSLPRRIDLELHAPSSECWSMISYHDIYAGLSNLLRNAIEAIPRIQQGCITITLKQDSEQFNLLIRDNGVGISRENLARIWDEGFTFGKSSGTGIGLAQVRMALKKNACKISVESTLGVGTTFVIVIPAEVRPKWIVNDIEVNTAQSVYVVDDDPAVLQYWKKRLKGFSVVALDSPTLLPKEFPLSSALVIDQYFPREIITGLGWLENNPHPKQTFVSTVEYYDESIQYRVQKLKVKMLLKKRERQRMNSAFFAGSVRL